MSKGLKIADTLTLPLDAQTSTFVVYGGKNMGKTNYAAVFAEELSRNNLRFSLLDPVGVSWGLQHGATKDQPGLPVLLLGGTHGDIPIEPTAGTVVADLVTDEAVSTVIDISRHPSGKMWSHGEKIRFVADYAARLFERQGEQRLPLMQIIDEAGRFVPQQIQQIQHGSVDIARCAGAIEQLVELGRNVGVGVTLVTQRSARMNKSVSELADCMIAFRTVGPRSVAAVLDWLGEHLEKDRRNVLLEQLRKLEVGTALVVSPGWLKFEGLARIRARETYDSSKTPQPGKRPAAPGKAAKPDLEKYRQLMAATIEKAAENDPTQLRKRIAVLQQQLLHAPKAVAAKDPPALATLAADNAKLRARAEKLEEQNAKLFELASGLVDGLHNMAGPAANTLALLRKGALAARAEVAKAVPPAARPAPAAAPREIRTSTPAAAPRGDLTSPEQRVLDSVAWLNSIGVDQPEHAAVAFVARYAVDSSSFKNPRGSLRAKGLIDFPQNGVMALTDAGQRLARAPDTPATEEELHSRVLEWLPIPEQRLLRPLLDAYPGSMSNEQLAAAANYAMDSSSFKNPRGRLRTLGLIEFSSPGHLRARSILFPAGR